MKLILISLTFAFSLQLAASPLYLKCLGKEEAYIHKNKLGGAYKHLNQTVLNELVMFSDTVVMEASLLQKICSSKILFPSLEILKGIILNNKIFTTSISNTELRTYYIDKTAIRSFHSTSKFIFTNFLTNLNSEIEDAHCMTREFPQLKDFYLKSRHVLMDVGIEKLINEIPQKLALFKKLKSLDWKKNCQQQHPEK